MANEKFVRVYKKLDFHDLRDHMLIYGDLSASCSKCKELDIKFEVFRCPSCQTDFKYIAFRNIKHHLPKVQRLSESHPYITLIDYDDYSRILGASKAEEFFK